MAERDILIVDDDRKVREVLHQIFISAGYNCLLANDGRDGVEVFKAGRPPLVVTALKMPGITGIELLQQVKAVDDDVAVIVVTGAADLKTVIASLKLGAHAFIMKPINMDELLIATERALERRQLLIERREYHELLERRAVEATRDLASKHQQLQDTYKTTAGWAEVARRNVLIVEHVRSSRQLFQDIFLAAGYECLLANDGREGLEVFRQSRPPLIVTELNMPVTRDGGKVAGAGIELLQHVRQEDRDAAVIVMSGAMYPKLEIVSLKLGAYAVIQKPIIMDELLIAAERALERRQLLIEHRRRQEGA
jgi:DNA-binding NtrC family response regulator